MTYTVFVTGANRGIGLEFVKQYVKEGWTIYATCRNPEIAYELKDLSLQYPKLTILKLDLSSEKEINDLGNQLKNMPLDVIINNAGILGQKTFSLNEITQKDLIEVFTINSISPLLVSKALISNLRLGRLKTVLAISSNAGSITESLEGDWNIYPYKASKTALNMLMSCFAIDPDYVDLRILLLHPGWVKTDMGGPDAEIDVEKSVLGMRAIVMDKSKNRACSGEFIDYKGNPIPW